MPLQHHFMGIFMAEPIFQRVGRIISATLEDAVDKLESAGSGSILRETVREVDRGIAQFQAERDDVQARLAQLARQQEQLRAEAAQLTEKARFALAEGREDLAEAALARQVDLEAQAEALKAKAEALARHEAEIAEGLGTLKARKVQMEQEKEAFLAQRLDQAMAGQGVPKAESDRRQELNSAQHAFERIISAAGAAPAPVDKIAEIDAMQKRAEVAARLAALK